MPATLGFHHLALLTEDVDRFTAFYVDVFDATVIDDLVEGGLRHVMLDLGAGACLHAFQIVGNPHAAGLLTPFDRGHLDHFALQAADEESFQALRARLVARGASDGTVTDFGSVRSVSFLDPDGGDAEVAVWADGPTLPFDERVREPFEPSTP